MIYLIFPHLLTEFKSDPLNPSSCQTNRPGSRDAIASKNEDGKL